ncbi:MAG: anion permease [Marinicellaceae bacterium]
MIVGFVCLFVTFLTEVTSNTATTAVLMPILLSTAVALEIDPMILMLPATISASFAFMMPVATAPNAIIFSSGHVPIKKMMRIGLFLNLIGAFILTLYFSFNNN